jgi:hypothetical protein
MRYHCHVYEVPRKAEIDIDAKTGMQAREKALEMAKNEKLIFGINKESQFQCISFIKNTQSKISKEQTHILIEKAFIYPPGLKQVFNPRGYLYDFEKGAWVKKQSKEFLVKEPAEKRHRMHLSSKKADMETGEDQKGE